MRVLGRTLAVCLLLFIATAHTKSADDAVLIGCFHPAFSEVQIQKYKIPHSLSWEECINFCLHRLTLQAGLQAEKGSLSYYHCFCGNDMDDHSTETNSTDCLPCEDNNDRDCGTETTLSLYQLRDSIPLALLLATDSSIELFLSSENTSTAIVRANNARYVDYYYKGDEIFFISRTLLYSSSFHPSTAKYVSAQELFDLNYRLSGLAVDWEHNHTYWGYSGDGLCVTDLLGKNRERLIDERGVKDLALDPYEMLLLYIAQEKLYSYTIGGPPVKNYNYLKLQLEKVISVALDVSQKIIFVTGSQDNIFYLKRMKYDGTDVKQLYSGAMLQNTFSMDVFHNEVVWGIKDGENYAIYKCYLTPRCYDHNVTLVYLIQQAVFDIKIYHPDVQVFDIDQMCTLLNCSHTCTAISQYEAICTCPKDMVINADKRTCKVLVDIKYIGCFSEYSAEIRQYRIQQSLTWEACVQVCDQRFVRVVAIQSEQSSDVLNHCFCGSNLEEYLKQTNYSKCLPCLDKKNKYCGADKTLSLYQLRESTPISFLLATDSGVKLLNSETSSPMDRIGFDSPVTNVDFSFNGDDILFISKNKILSYYYSPSLRKYNLLEDFGDSLNSNNDMVIDWMYNKTYWSGYIQYYNAIFEAGINGSEASPIVTISKKVALSLAVDPYKRLLFFTNSTILHCLNLESKELKKYNNGKYRLKTLEKLAVDIVQDIIYVLATEDLENTVLMSVDYGDTKSREIYNGPELKTSIEIAVFKKDVYWLNHKDNLYTMYRCPLAPKCYSEHLTVVYQFREVIYDFKIYHPEVQVFDTNKRCALLNCSHSCTAISQYEVACTCPKDMEINADKRTCKVLVDIKYIGCFSEYTVEIKQYRIQQSLSWEGCVQVCNQRFVRVVAIQSEQSSDMLNHCFCGSNLEEYLKQTKISKCLPCLDRKDKYCGAVKTLSLYQLRESTPISFLLATNSGVKLLNSETSSPINRIAYNSTVKNVDFSFSGDDILFTSGDKIFSYYYSPFLTKYNLLEDFENSGSSKNDLVIDWVYNKTYWISYSHEIFEASLNGSNTTSIYTISESTNISLALDPYKRLLFFTDAEILYSFHLESKKLLRTYNNGKYRLKTVKKIALDIVQEIIYVLGTEDLKKIYLASLDYGDTKFRVLYNGPEIQNAVKIAVFKNDVYWLSSKDNRYTIYKCPLTPIFNSIHLTVVYQLTEPIYDMKLYHPEVQMPDTVLLCKKLRCSHICSTTSLPLIKCSCPETMVIGADNRTCEDPPTTSLTSSITATTKVGFIIPEILDDYHEETSTMKVPRKDPVQEKSNHDKSSTSRITFMDAFMIAIGVLVVSLLLALIYLQTRPTSPENNFSFTYKHAAEMDELTHNYNVNE